MGRGNWRGHCFPLRFSSLFRNQSNISSDHFFEWSGSIFDTLGQAGLSFCPRSFWRKSHWKWYICCCAICSNLAVWSLNPQPKSGIAYEFGAFSPDFQSWDGSVTSFFRLTSDVVLCWIVVEMFSPLGGSHHVDHSFVPAQNGLFWILR